MCYVCTCMCSIADVLCMYMYVVSLMCYVCTRMLSLADVLCMYMYVV